MLNKLKIVNEKLSPGLRKIISNMGWLSAEKLLRMILSFLVGVYVIRYLGPDNFGKLSYGISFVALFIAISKLGLDQIVIRNLVEQENLTTEILGTAFLIKSISSVLAVCLIVPSILYVTDDIQVQKITIIIAIGLVFSNFDVLDLWFQSQVLSKSIAIVRSAQFLITSFAKLAFILLNLPLIAFAYLFLVDSVVRALGMCLAYYKENQSIFKWKISKSSIVSLLKDSSPLILSNVMVTIYLKIDQVMLGNMSSSKEVGNYAAAVKFSEIWYFIPMIVCSSVFPAIIISRQKNQQECRLKMQQLFDFLTLLSLSIAVFVSLTSNFFITNLLGYEYSTAASILIVHIWAGIFIFWGVAKDRWLIAENAAWLHLITQLLGATTNVLLNLIFIPLYGGMGAAISTLISYAVSSYFTCFLFPHMFDIGQMLTKSLFAPFRLNNIFKPLK